MKETHQEVASQKQKFNFMASKGGRSRRTVRKPTTTTTQLKKKKIKNSNKNKNKSNEEINGGSRSGIEELLKVVGDSDSSSDFEGCCTPKAERFKIPEIKICPPAPKKQRIISNCSLQQQRPSPIAFFASPDIELFFFFSQSHLQN